MCTYLKRLKDLRKSFGLSQQKLAEIVNVSQSSISKYESGTLSIPTDIVIEMAKFYDVSTDYIAGLTNKRHSYREWK